MTPSKGSIAYIASIFRRWASARRVVLLPLAQSERAAIDGGEGSGLGRFKSIDDRGDASSDDRPVIVGHTDHCDLAASHVLLIGEFLVSWQDRLKPSVFSGSQKIAVRQFGPAQLVGTLYIVRRKILLQWEGTFWSNRTFKALELRGA